MNTHGFSFHSVFLISFSIASQNGKNNLLGVHLAQMSFVITCCASPIFFQSLKRMFDWKTISENVRYSLLLYLLEKNNSNQTHSFVVYITLCLPFNGRFILLDIFFHISSILFGILFVCDIRNTLRRCGFTSKKMIIGRQMATPMIMKHDLQRFAIRP